MAKPKRPANFYINRGGGASILVWDKVVKDIEQNYTNVIGYYIYKTTNPSGSDWGSPIFFVGTTDNFGDPDVIYIDYSPDNTLYKVCPYDGVELGECVVSYGIVSEGSITTIPEPAKWDSGLWDQGIWG